MAIPVVSSVTNELCTYFDSKSVEKRLHEFEKKLEKQSISIETMQNRINQLSEHGQYVFRNILKHLCLSALPETTDALINCLIAYLMEDKQDMSEELCEIVCSCNANDIQLLRMIKHFLSEGKREFRQKMIAKSQNDISESRTDENENTNKVYTPIRWRDRNVIYGENTIFWADFTEFYELINVKDMGVMLNRLGKNEEGNEVYDWAFLIRSLLKFQSKGVVQLEFLSSLGTISSNNIDRFHITLFGQNLLRYIEGCE